MHPGYAGVWTKLMAIAPPPAREHGFYVNVTMEGTRAMRFHSLPGWTPGRSDIFRRIRGARRNLVSGIREFG